MKYSPHIPKAYLAALALCLAVPVAAADKKDDAGFREKMKEWQEQMSDKFRDTWDNLWNRDKEKSVTAASIDLREQNDNYTLRLSLPNRDVEKLDVQLSDGRLRLIAPAEEKAGRYEQTFALAGVASDAQAKVDRKPKDHMVVITVPKSSGAAQTPSTSPLDWDRDVISRMDDMRREMDRVFENAFREFKGMPEHRSLFDEPRFGSSIDLKEEGNNYVARVYLPEHDMANVNVTVEKDLLKIEAKQTKSDDKKELLRSERQSSYFQVVTLPGPVKADKMTVDRKDGMLVVTLPKAG